MDDKNVRTPQTKMDTCTEIRTYFSNSSKNGLIDDVNVKNLIVKFFVLRKREQLTWQKLKSDSILTKHISEALDKVKVDIHLEPDKKERLSDIRNVISGSAQEDFDRFEDVIALTGCNQVCLARLVDGLKRMSLVQIAELLYQGGN